MTISAEQLATLARAMGYEVSIDSHGGYGVVRVVMGSGGVFNPMADAAQAWDVLAWLDRVNDCFTLGVGYVASNMQRVNHNQTPTDLRRAVVTAAVRVAEGK